MATIAAASNDPRLYDPRAAGRPPQRAVTAANALSWGAVLAGAATAFALSLVLTVMGTAMALTAVVSFWNATTAHTAGRLEPAAVGAWLIFMQLTASAAGGYVAGYVGPRQGAGARRDALQGLLAWGAATLAAGVALVVILAVLGSALPYAWTAQDQADALAAVLWLAVSLLAGAVIAGVAGAYGGWRAHRAAPSFLAL